MPALLYRLDRIEDELAYVERATRQLARAGSRTLVLGPSAHHDGYDTSVEMTEEEWVIFNQNLRRLQEIASAQGLVTALHQHWGMAIERMHHLERLLDTSDVSLCLDTGHAYLGSVDPVAVAKLAPDRVAHVHLKDVEPAAADRVRSGEVPFRQAVIDGMFVPLGAGDVDIAGVIRTLEKSGFTGWYVLEQDVALSEEPDPGAGPKADAELSVEFLRGLTTEQDIQA